jgi:hypothetical protein
MKQKIGLLLSGFLLLAITTWSQNQNANNNDSLFISAAAQEKFNAGVGAFEKQDFTSAVTAFSEAIDKSQTTCKTCPPPIAYPFTIAITGFGIERMALCKSKTFKRGTPFSEM